MPNAVYTLSARVSLALLLLLAPRVVRADWPTSTLVNLPICTATGQQLLPRIATDGSGGAVIVWHDSRVAGDYDIYAQRVLSTGVVDPGWPLNGAVVCSAAGNQS